MAIRVDGHDGVGSLLVLRGEGERGVRIVLRGVPAKQYSVSKTRDHTKTLYLYIRDVETLYFFVLLLYRLEFLRTGAFLYTPCSFLLISSKFWMGGGVGGAVRYCYLTYFTALPQWGGGGGEQCLSARCHFTGPKKHSISRAQPPAHIEPKTLSTEPYKS